MNKITENKRQNMNDFYPAVKKHINIYFQPQKYMTPPQD